MLSLSKLQTKAISIILRTRTVAHVTCLQLMGKKIKIGKGTIFSASARVSPGNGVIIMGDNCFVGAGAVVRANNGKICLCDAVSIGEYSMLHGNGKIYVGKDTLIATHVSLLAARHKFSRRDIPIRHQGVKSGYILIGRDCWIGSDVKIMDNIRVRQGSILGAGAIVTKSTDAYGIYGGNPARKIGERD